MKPIPKRRGRPPIENPRKRIYGFRLTERQAELLAELCWLEDASLSDIVRESIATWAKELEVQGEPES